MRSGLDLGIGPSDAFGVMDDVSVLRVVEITSLFILGGFLFLMSRAGGGRGAPGRDIVIVASAAWVAEVSCMRLYHFYQYDAPWLVFVDLMPLLVALIWPFVILSARQLSESLGLRSALFVFLFVLYDASLVEPLAVAARLWSWNEPGVFGVPPIGIFGWAYFAFFVLIGLERLHGRQRWLIILVAPIATHVALLLSWWGLFRWVLRTEIASDHLALISCLVAAGLTVAFWVDRRRAPLEVMLPRMAAALLFFGLLALCGRATPALTLYALAFAVPYLTATRFGFGTRPVALDTQI